ncbi:hypothetical protein LUZ60_006804 [Juncus effusus]|nr:hypothetical protein LUZ60_006804 [Juncus effusus]
MRWNITKSTRGLMDKALLYSSVWSSFVCSLLIQRTNERKLLSFCLFLLSECQFSLFTRKANQSFLFPVSKATSKRKMWHGKSHHVHDMRNAIPDNFTSVDQVINALRESGLESSNLILAMDFTKSNEWTGRRCFNRKSLHFISNSSSQKNPYEQAISIIGRTLSPFDEDNLIPCFGFGDSTTHDHSVFGFFEDLRPCQGFEEVLERYRLIVPHLNLSGPTSFAPVINAAISIVEKSWQYHVLVIIADGQVTGNTKGGDGKLSPQEEATIDAIVTASNYPLSIVMVGVGDGPWDAMQHFDDCIPQRSFDNFQFVNFTKIMSSNMDMSKKEAAFALSALMEMPIQFRATQRLQPPQNRKQHAPKILPPPSQVIEIDNAASAPPLNATRGSIDDNAPVEQVCPICLTNPKDMAFQCGHLTCKDCGSTLGTCPICRAEIKMRVRLYS